MTNPWATLRSTPRHLRRRSCESFPVGTEVKKLRGAEVEARKFPFRREIVWSLPVLPSRGGREKLGGPLHPPNENTHIASRPS